jgi:hypothetical protein
LGHHANVVGDREARERVHIVRANASPRGVSQNTARLRLYYGRDNGSCLGVRIGPDVDPRWKERARCGGN